MSFLVFTLFLGIFCLVYSQEPKCPARYMEERLLEKMLEIDLKLQQALQRMDEMENERRNSTDLLSSELFPRRALLVSQLEIDGWKMVFRAASGNGYPVYDAWTQGRGTCEDKPVSMERSYSCHYRQRNLASWSVLGVRYVKFALYTQEKEEAYVIFNGIGSDMNNWFSQDRVISSSYSDLTAGDQYNYFSIPGHLDGNRLIRRFFINRNYHGCPGDRGHIVVIDESRTSPACLMDTQPSYPKFLYSRTNSVDFWERATYGMADYLAVFIKQS